MDLISLRRMFLVLFIVSLPILWGFQVAFKTIVLSDIFFLGLMATHAALLFINNNWRLKLRENAPLIILVSCSFLLLLMASYLANSLDSTTAKELLRFAYSFVVFVVIASLGVNEMNFELIGKSLVYSGSAFNFVALLSLIGYKLFGIPAVLLDTDYVFDFTAVQGFTHNPKTYMVFCFICLSLNVYLVVRHKAKNSYKLLLVINILAGFLTFQKEFFHIFLFAFIFALIIVQRKRLRNWLAASFLTTFIFLQILVFFSAVIYVVPVVVKNGIDRPLSISMYPKFAYYYIYKSGANMFMSNPIAGKGLGKYASYMSEYLSPDDAEDFLNNYGFFNKADLESSSLKEAAQYKLLVQDLDPHSTWIGIAAESGILGLASLATIFFFVISKLIFKLKSSDKLIPAVMLALLMCLLSMSIQFDFIYLKIVWVIMGISVTICTDDKVRIV